MRSLIRLFFKLTLSINIGLIRSFIDEPLQICLENILSNNPEIGHLLLSLGDCSESFLASFSSSTPDSSFLIAFLMSSTIYLSESG